MNTSSHKRQRASNQGVRRYKGQKPRDAQNSPFWRRKAVEKRLQNVPIIGTGVKEERESPVEETDLLSSYKKRKNGCAKKKSAAQWVPRKQEKSLRPRKSNDSL